LYYYLWYAKSAGKRIKGVLVYPKEKKREEVILTEEIEREIEKIVKEIPKIVKQKVPPEAIKKPYCSTYYELCWV